DNDGAALMESATHHISLTCRPPLDQKQEPDFVLIFETRKSVEIKAPTERKFPWSRCPQEKSRPARFSGEKPTAKKTFERGTGFQANGCADPGERAFAESKRSSGWPPAPGALAVVIWE